MPAGPFSSARGPSCWLVDSQDLSAFRSDSIRRRRLHGSIQLRHCALNSIAEIEERSALGSRNTVIEQKAFAFLLHFSKFSWRSDRRSGPFDARSVTYVSGRSTNIAMLGAGCHRGRQGVP